MSVSAIVLTHDRKAFRDDAVEMLRRQSVVPDEIIVAKNTQRGAGVAECRNKHAMRARGDWLLFTYDDGIYMHDTVESLLRRADQLGRDDILLNVTSVDIELQGTIPPEDKLYWMIENGARGTVIREIMSGKRRQFFLEQHCSLINRLFFDQIGGYDAKSFPGWSLHEQDLAMRVIRAGGVVDSNIYRNNGQYLFNFHRIRNIDPLAADKRKWVEASQGDFIRKYGRRFSVSLINDLMRTARQERPAAVAPAEATWAHMS